MRVFIAILIVVTTAAVVMMAPRCDPSDHRSVRVGNMLMGGCP